MKKKFSNVIIAYNKDFCGVLKKKKIQTQEKYGEKTIDKIASVLKEKGYYVEIIDANVYFIEKLIDFTSRRGVDNTIVFNLAYGIQGEARYTHVPSILEMLGLPYTGSGPLGHTLVLDKVATKLMFLHGGIPTPNFFVVSKRTKQAYIPATLNYPLVVKPRFEAVSLGISVVMDEHGLIDSVNHIIEEFDQDVLVEEFIEGREFAVSLIGNGEGLMNFPVTEIVLEGGIQTYLDKVERPPQKIAPADIPPYIEMRMIELSKRAFNLLGLRDYARFDIRMNPSGELFFLEVNSMASLGLSGSYVYSAMSAGLTYEELINKILEVAMERYERDA